MVWKNKYMRENNEILTNGLEKSRIYDDETLESMKKYYGIDDHRDLLRYLDQMDQKIMSIMIKK